MLIFVLNFQSAKPERITYYVVDGTNMYLSVKSNDAVIEQKYLN